jgi:hypothetical protein
MRRAHRVRTSGRYSERIAPSSKCERAYVNDDDFGVLKTRDFPFRALKARVYAVGVWRQFYCERKSGVRLRGNVGSGWRDPLDVFAVSLMTRLLA